MYSNRNRTLFVTAALGIALLSLPATAQVAAVDVGAAAINWNPQVAYERLVLTVSGPSGVQTFEFAAGEAPSFDLFDRGGYAVEDGQYTWELRAVPRVSLETRARLETARAAGETPAELRRSTEDLVQSGYFRVHGGAFVRPDEAGEARLATRAPSGEGGSGLATRDQVILDDLIVDGSICAGLDCVNGESFGFDTLRLKENNLRIKAQDTSSSASFPSNDWQITFNESSNGGANKFSIDDIDGGRTPFTIEAGAPTNSLYVDDGGRIGLGTATPVVEVHVVDGDTPTVRLEQDGSSGFTPQTWDMAGNETNWFVRDATNGSTLPLRIRPSAPSNSIFVDTDGDIGIGTSSPTGGAQVHVRQTDGSAQIFVEEASSTNAVRDLLKLTNNGNVRMLLSNSNLTFPWAIRTVLFNGTDNDLFINILDGSTNNLRLHENGDMTIAGTNYFTGSSRELKENFVPVDGADILARLTAMPLTSWSPKTNPEQRNIGPIAEDWWATFGLGSDDKHVGMTDVGGVALAAIQGLHQTTTSELEALRQENDELKQRLEALEALVSSLSP